MKRLVIAQTQFEAVHAWPDCPIEEVKYLRVPHRHVFHVRAEKEVTHGDRDVEFIWLKHRINEETASWPEDLGATSCEMIAEHLVGSFALYACEVFEDAENGARIELESGETTDFRLEF